MRKLFWLMSLILFGSCSSELNLKGKDKSEERVQLAKNFANDFFSKCEKKDYSEMQGYKVDVNLKNKLSSEKIKTNCEYYQEKYGTIKVGKLCDAKTYYNQKNFLDYFTFYAKGSKNDSLQFVKVNIYRDDNMFQGIIIPKYKVFRRGIHITIH